MASKAEDKAAARPAGREPAALVITTPLNPEYGGITFGVQFHGGRADVTEHAAPNRWGYSLADLAERFRRRVDGYQVEVIYADGEREVFPARAGTIEPA